MRHVVIDGYNVLRSASRYSRIARDDLDVARTRLVTDAAVLADEGTRVTVVFDAGANPASSGAAHHVAGVVVVFSRHGMSADDVVERLAARARTRGDEVVVVTSDAATQRTVIGGPVTVMPVREFEREVVSALDGMRERSFSGGTSVRLEERVSEEVRRALDRWVGRSAE
ncbi:MAG: NYN domain-containing protein [Coriobacteriia bacterium]|nr:NYN domain-containing protein [Coriobacteriia bacterium]